MLPLKKGGRSMPSSWLQNWDGLKGNQPKKERNWGACNWKHCAPPAWSWILEFTPRGWTIGNKRQTYLINALGYTSNEAEQDVARYASAPGQATAYMVGMLKILELRERAKTALEDRFDLRQFHDQILGKGKIPLSLLEQVVENWIQKKLLEPASP